MPPIKLSISRPGGDQDDTVELDESLVERLRQTVDAHPDLTLAEALRQGIEHVVTNGPRFQDNRQA
jgi:hypothetical protein